MSLEALRRQVAALPAGTSFSRDAILELLAGVDETAPPPAEVLDAAGLASRWKRSPSAVRALLEAGVIPAAWKHQGRAWRVRVVDVVEYEATLARRTHHGREEVSLRAVARGRG